VSKRLLVTYGFHLGEKFAEQVGMEYAKLDIPHVVTAKVKGIKGYNQRGPHMRGYDPLAQMRRDIGAKYLVNLHDDSPSLQRLSPSELRKALEVEREVNPHYKYDLTGHMGRKHATELLDSFARKWNERRRHP
jgi:hypothetical protein